MTIFLDEVNLIAKNVDRDWSMADYDYRKFAAIAENNLNAKTLVSTFDFCDIIEFLNSTSIQNVQISSEFSELHLKLYDNGKFYIEVLNWWGLDTAIHDHNFSGILLQLEGNSLNAIYSFDNEKEISHNLSIGDVELESAYLSEKGDYRVIPPGRSEKHAVLHLLQPTISLIIRTHPITELSPQLSYFPPAIRANHSVFDITFNKRIKFFKFLYKTDKTAFVENFLQFYGSSSDTTRFWLLTKLASIIFSPDGVEILDAISKTETDAISEKTKSQMLQSVAARRYSQILIDTIKPKFKDSNSRLIVSMLASSYNRKNFVKMCDLLSVENHDADIERIGSSLSGQAKFDFKTAVAVLCS